MLKQSLEPLPGFLKAGVIGRFSRVWQGFAQGLLEIQYLKMRGI
jgi:hypothetical protein